MKESKGSTQSLLAFPKGGIAYTEKFYREAEASGLLVGVGKFGLRWLFRNLPAYDAVHIHWPSFFYATGHGVIGEVRDFLRFALFLCYARLRGVRIFWTAHNLYPHDSCSTPGLHRLARKVLIRLSTRIFVHGETARRDLTNEFPEAAKKSVVIDHGNWLDFYRHDKTRAEARQELGIQEDTFVYLFIGLCKPYKNLHLLVEKFAEAPANSLLLIAGRFDDELYYRSVSEKTKSVPREVRIDARMIPDDELQVFLKACDVVVLPYAKSLTSGAAILALSFGRPVVAPRLGHLCDLIGPETGILYDPDDPGALGVALNECQRRTYSEDTILGIARRIDWHSAVEALRAG